MQIKRRFCVMKEQEIIMRQTAFFYQIVQKS